MRAVIGEGSCDRVIAALARALGGERNYIAGGRCVGKRSCADGTGKTRGNRRSGIAAAIRCAVGRAVDADDYRACIRTAAGIAAAAERRKTAEGEVFAVVISQ